MHTPYIVYTPFVIVTNLAAYTFQVDFQNRILHFSSINLNPVSLANPVKYFPLRASVLKSLC